MKKIIFAVAVLALMASCSQDSDTLKAQKLIQYHKQKYDSLPLTGTVVNGVREIELKAYQYRWEPENIVVKKGEKIRFTVESIGSPHGFEIEGILIPGWDPDTAIRKGENITIGLTAEDAGTWDIVCTSYCGPGHGGMKGKYIVRE